MLSRKNRLNLRLSENRAIFRFGQRWQKSSLEAAYDFQGETFQAGVIISKKNVSQSSTRNALRRKIFDAIPVSLQSLKTLRLIIRAKDSRAALLTKADLEGIFSDLEAKITQ